MRRRVARAALVVVAVLAGAGCGGGPAAQRRLNTALHAARGRRAQADALEAYARALAGPLRTLRALASPHVTAPVLAGEVRTLARVSSTARGLADALHRRRLAQVPAL